MLFNIASTPLNHFIFGNDKFEIWKDEISNHHSLFSVVDFRPGDIVCDFGAAAILPAPSPLTVQVGINEHIYLQPGVLQYINHSCSPNIFFDLSSFKAICLRAIHAWCAATSKPIPARSMMCAIAAEKRMSS